MSNTAKALTDIRTLEELSRRDTFVHRRHPVANLLISLLYILAVASYGKYALTAMLPLVLYPVFVFSTGEIPAGPIMKRLLPALPLAVGVGVFNPLFDHNTVLVMGAAVPAGWLSFLSILLRLLLSVAAALLLVAVTGMGGLSTGLRALGTPKILVAQLLMTFRYIHVLAEEAGRMSLAYRLRAPGQKGVAWRYWGPFAGQWLLRSLNRADRLHRAMLCRGYAGELPEAPRKPFGAADLAYLAAWAAFFAAARFIDIPRAIGALILTIGG